MNSDGLCLILRGYPFIASLLPLFIVKLKLLFGNFLLLLFLVFKVFFFKFR